MRAGYGEQAAFYRAALLLGLLRGEQVIAWADDVLGGESDAAGAFVEIATTSPEDLTLLRQRLLALCDEKESAEVVAALLGLVHRDLASSRRSLRDTMTVLKQLRLTRSAGRFARRVAPNVSARKARRSLTQGGQRRAFELTWL